MNPLYGLLACLAAVPLGWLIGQAHIWCYESKPAAKTRVFNILVYLNLAAGLVFVLVRVLPGIG